MRKRTKDQPENDAVEESTSDSETVTASGEYTLKKPITFRGSRQVPGAKVKLNARQADWLKESGHI